MYVDFDSKPVIFSCKGTVEVEFSFVLKFAMVVVVETDSYLVVFSMNLQSVVKKPYG